MKTPKVYYKNLVKVWGYAHTDKNKIELSLKLKGKKHLEILTHELLHIILPDFDEESIKEFSKMMTEVYWKESYRKLNK